MAKIEAQIALQLDGELGHRRANDVLLVKLPGAPWSDAEMTRSRVVEMDSDDYPTPVANQIIAVHDAMMAQRDAGEPHPCEVHPFAVYGTPDDSGTGPMTERSTMQLDINDLPSVDRAETTDPGRKLGILRTPAAVKLKRDLRRAPR